MTLLLAIDPGPVESAYTLIDADTCEPHEVGKVPNADMLGYLTHLPTATDLVAIEMIASYGMPVGREVFETCVWIGRYIQCLTAASVAIVRTPRQPVKLHHCHSARATDANVRQALVDRFTPGQPNHGKGTKGSPGFFHEFRADIWQAMALAVYTADHLREEHP